MTPNDPNMFNVQNTIMHVTYTIEAQFSYVSLYDEPFVSYDPIIAEVHQMTPNDLSMFKVKISTCMPHTPQGKNFRPFRFRVSRF